MILYYIARLFKKFKPVAKCRSKIHPLARVGGGTQIIDSTMDRHSYCGYDCTILNTKIGAFCSIASNVKIGLASHPMEWVSTSSEFYGVENAVGGKLAKNVYDSFPNPTTVGNDVWIAENVMIKAGVTIGTGAVIAMGAIVTKDVGPYEIWGGNPARCIRKRFDETTIEKLLATQWWTWEEEKLAECSHLIPNPEAFLRNYFESGEDNHE